MPLKSIAKGFIFSVEERASRFEDGTLAKQGGVC